MRALAMAICTLATIILYACSSGDHDASAPTPPPDNPSGPSENAEKPTPTLPTRAPTPIKLVDLKLKPFVEYDDAASCNALAAFAAAFAGQVGGTFELGACQTLEWPEGRGRIQWFTHRGREQSVAVKKTVHAEPKFALCHEKVSINDDLRSTRVGCKLIPHGESFPESAGEFGDGNFWELAREYFTGTTSTIAGYRVEDFFAALSHHYETVGLAWHGDKPPLTFAVQQVAARQGTAQFHSLPELSSDPECVGDEGDSRSGRCQFLGCVDLDCLNDPENPVELSIHHDRLTLRRQTSKVGGTTTFRFAQWCLDLAADSELGIFSAKGCTYPAEVFVTSSSG